MCPEDMHRGVLDLSFSAESLRSFAQMTSSLSIKSFSRLGTSRSVLSDVGQMASTLSLPTPTASNNLCFGGGLSLAHCFGSTHCVSLLVSE